MPPGRTSGSKLELAHGFGLDEDPSIELELSNRVFVLGKLAIVEPGQMHPDPIDTCPPQCLRPLCVRLVSQHEWAWAHA